MLPLAEKQKVFGKFLGLSKKEIDNKKEDENRFHLSSLKESFQKEKRFSLSKLILPNSSLLFYLILFPEK